VEFVSSSPHHPTSESDNGHEQPSKQNHHAIILWPLAIIGSVRASSIAIGTRICRWRQNKPRHWSNCLLRASQYVKGVV
jgi:hypothetical protein